MLYEVITLSAINFLTTAREKSFLRSAFSRYLSPAVISEIINDPSKLNLGGRITSYNVCYTKLLRYLDPEGAALQIPADIDEALTRKVRQTAIQAYRALDLSGLSRVDFFIDKRNDTLYLNEINTIPGFTSISSYNFV